MAGPVRAVLKWRIPLRPSPKAGPPETRHSYEPSSLCRFDAVRGFLLTFPPTPTLTVESRGVAMHPSPRISPAGFAPWTLETWSVAVGQCRTLVSGVFGGSDSKVVPIGTNYAWGPRKRTCTRQQRSPEGAGTLISNETVVAFREER